MQKPIKIILSLATILFLALLIILNINRITHHDKKLSIIVTNFPAYDFARAITQDSANIKMLIKPGTETHHFEPTPEDIIEIMNSDLFIYTGGESDQWISNLLTDNNIKPEKTIKMMDFVNLLEESHLDEHSEPHEQTHYDEHIWTSLNNASLIINGLATKLSEISPSHTSLFRQNAEKYNNQLSSLDQQFRSVVQESPHKTLIFADRFPFQYFVEDYGLNYYSAFPGCSEQTEVSSQTIASIIDVIKTKSIPVIFKIELSDSKLADTISKETGTKILEFHSAHNISTDDFNAGVTYLDLMQRNLIALKEALN